MAAPLPVAPRSMRSLSANIFESLGSPRPAASASQASHHLGVLERHAVVHEAVGDGCATRLVNALGIGATGHAKEGYARAVTARTARYAHPMKGWLLVLPFAAGCSPQYTREQAKNCAAAESAGTAFWGSVAEDSPTHTRETALAALPVLIDRLKSFPPGSAGADEEIKGLISSATDLQAKVPALSPTATKEDTEPCSRDSFSGTTRSSAAVRKSISDWPHHRSRAQLHSLQGGRRLGRSMK